MSLDTEVLIIGAGMSGCGLAIQLVRKYGFRSFNIIEKTGKLAGTWSINTYPNCGCDVASHFYSYSFALNPNWSQKFSLQSEIQDYFENVAEQYNLLPHINFNSSVETAHWNEAQQLWEVTVKDEKKQKTRQWRCRILVSAVGSLSVPRKCETPGSESFQGPLFHSAQWDPSFDWTDKDVVVLGNGCSATQFVPVLAEKAKTVTQFARQAHHLSERPNPVYGPTFKAVMKYVPLAMRLYRFWLYADMEKDFAGFHIKSGARVRQGWKEDNIAYVKRMAPERYWDALIPKHEIGCKRKVMDTDYLACLHRDNMELVHSDPVEEIIEEGVRTRSGRVIRADAILLANGFQVFRMLFPIQIYGENGISLNKYWDESNQGAPQAYFGTAIPGFKNFFTLFGPNTTTGHLSVIYTVECQINWVLRLIEPILKTTTSTTNLLGGREITSVDVKLAAAKRDSEWMQSRLKQLVWSSGCTSWALDPKTGLNIAMYPQYQFLFWLRSIFVPSQDFDYEFRTKDGLRKTSLSVGGWKSVRRFVATLVTVTALTAGVLRVRGETPSQALQLLRASLRGSLNHLKRTLTG